MRDGLIRIGFAACTGLLQGIAARVLTWARSTDRRAAPRPPPREPPPPDG